MDSFVGLNRSLWSRRRTPIKLSALCTSLLFAVTFFAASGCDVFSGEDIAGTRDAIRERVETARQTWKEQQISTYRVVYSQQRGKAPGQKVEVFVSAGTVDSVRAVRDDSRNISKDDLLVDTIDSFFNRILNRVGEDDSRFNANFDDEQGYPVRYEARFNDRPAESVTTEMIESLE